MGRRTWPMTRRTVLRGLGAAVALPFLEAMEALALFGGEPKVVPRKQPVRFAASPGTQAAHPGARLVRVTLCDGTLTGAAATVAVTIAR